MATMPKYQIAMILDDLGFRPSEIASTLYPDERDRNKAVIRVCALLWKYKRKVKCMVKENSSKSYRAPPVIENGNGDYVVFDSRYYPGFGESHAPVSNGTSTIRERKLWANEFERQMAEYEQLLYFLYNAVFRRVDDDAKSMWQSVKIVFLETFREFYSRFHVKYYHSRKRKYVKALTAAYVYYVFFFGLRNYYEYATQRRLFVKRLLGMVRNIGEFEKAKKEVINLFYKY